MRAHRRSNSAWVVRRDGVEAEPCMWGRWLHMV
jgi:hypothetical protein